MRKLRICLLGECSRTLDEGMRKVGIHLFQELSKDHQVLFLDLRDVLFRNFWTSIKRFNPQIVHYIHGPTIKSFMLLKSISLYCQHVKTVMSAMHPSLPSFFKKLVSLLKPDLTLIQSYETESMFKRLGCRVEFLPCGVDVKKFTPVTAETKIKLRKKYGIEKEKFVILHVGSIKEGRNIQFLTKLQKEDNQVLIIGATSTGINQKLCQELRKSGCLVWTKYFEHIEEIYGLSDCYVFPVMFKVDFTGRPVSDSIEMPLSILEAMACNLPVISTKFGALPRIFHEKEGLIYANREEDFLQAVKKIKNGINVRNREKVLPYSWEKVAEKLQQIYSYLISKY